MDGLEFNQARKVVLSCLKRCTDTPASRPRRKLFIYISVLPTISTFALIIVIYSVPTINIGLIATVFFAAASIFYNLYIFNLYKKSAEDEIQNDIKRFCTDYDEFLSKYKSYCCDDKQLQVADQEITAGHPHISMVTCYRNKQWQRVPSLLLAEGDLIALQAGDIAPGDCCEIVYHRSNHTRRSHNDLKSEELADPMLSSISQILRKKGDKIYLAEKQHAPSFGSYEKHRSLASDGLELLQLSGDVRCFKMAETPIESFTQTILSDNVITGIDSSPQESICEFIVSLLSVPIARGVGLSKSKGDSIIRILFITALRRGVYLAILLVLLLLCCGVVRYSLQGAARTNWALSSLIPIISTTLCFAPLSLPLFLLIADATMTASLLATTEAILEGEGDDRNDEYTKDARASSRHNEPISNSRKGLSYDDNAGGRTASISTHRERRHSLGNSACAPSSADGDDDSEDEFLDSDIDERVEELADEASMRISAMRRAQYTVSVLLHRIGCAHILPFFLPASAVCGKAHESQGLSGASASLPASVERGATVSYRPLLPIPHIRTNLLELLGAVTMVCFVDDDVLCENYSVAEELYLLRSPDRGDGATATAMSAARGAGGGGGGGGARGTVLDLHANPEAGGSRFEDPNWWKFLPSLKPVGLNAMLTYTPLAPISQVPMSYSLSGSSPRALDSADSIPAAGSDVYGASVGPSVRSQAVGTRSHRSSKTQHHHHHHHHHTSINDTEVSLVAHVRKAMPLESLRELAEEIGFVKEDVSHFVRLLEMNIVAPGLGDAKLLEDTHAWGPEETRRRGTLLTQVRGSVVMDTNTGSLQMMCQGDPALLLHYCREHWDGTSITPVTYADRMEVLGVYDRWDLEDFDVVAFSYTPLPQHLQAMILEAYFESEEGGHAGLLLTNGGGGGGAAVQSKKSILAKRFAALAALGSGKKAKRRSQSNCIYIVDPYKETDLQQLRNQNKAKLAAAAAAAAAEVAPANSASSVVNNTVLFSVSGAAAVDIVATQGETSSKSGSQGKGQISIPHSSPAHLSSRLPHSEFEICQGSASNSVLMGSGSATNQHSQHGTGTPAPGSALKTDLARRHSDPMLTTSQSTPISTGRSSRRQLSPLLISAAPTLNTASDAIDNEDKLSSTWHSSPAFSRDGARSEDNCNHLDMKGNNISLSFVNPTTEESCTNSGPPSPTVVRYYATEYGGGFVGADGSSSSSMKDVENKSRRTVRFTRSTSEPSLDIDPIHFNSEKRSVGDAGGAAWAEIDMDSHGDRGDEGSHLVRRQSDAAFEMGRRVTSSAGTHKSDMVYDGGDGDGDGDGAGEVVDGDEGAEAEADVQMASMVLDEMDDIDADLEDALEAELSDGRYPYVDGDAYGEAEMDPEGDGGVDGGAYTIDDLLNGEGENGGAGFTHSDDTVMEAVGIGTNIEGTSVDFSVSICREARVHSNSTAYDPDVGLDLSLPPASEELSGKNTLQRMYSSPLSPSSSPTVRVSKDDEALDSSPPPPLPLLKSKSLDSALYYAQLQEQRGKRDGTTKARGSSSALTQSSEKAALPRLRRKGSRKQSKYVSPGAMKGQRSHATRGADSSQGAQGPAVRGRNPRHRARVRSVGASLWPYMRQQVFLGMAASSVPVRSEIRDLQEELTKAGVRFVFFSPRNMRRSKHVAEKIGISFDWNFAISLRDLDGSYDQHRVVSSYADSVVLARMPYGVEAIKQHLREVDNVPLLVSLYTDATPATIEQMVGVFQQYGEVVLTVGSAYREHNQHIFRQSNVAVSVATLPGHTGQIPSEAAEVIRAFPEYSNASLCRADLLLHFRLVGLGALPLLQRPSPVSVKCPHSAAAAGSATPAQPHAHSTLYPSTGDLERGLDDVEAGVTDSLLGSGAAADAEGPEYLPGGGWARPRSQSTSQPANIPPQLSSSSSSTSLPGDGRTEVPFSLNIFPGPVPNTTPQLRMSALLEGIRTGRIYLLNALQALAVGCICCIGLGTWPLVSNAVPMTLPPSLPPCMALLFLCFHIPVILLAILHGPCPEVMKKTPRKNILVTRDEARFASYLLTRCVIVALSTFFLAWVGAASAFKSPHQQWYHRMVEFTTLDFSVSPAAGGSSSTTLAIAVSSDEKQFWLVQDVISCGVLLSMLAQAATLLERGQRGLKCHVFFTAASIIVMLVHGSTLFVRAYLRNGLNDYMALDWIVWVVMIAMAGVGLVVGIQVNAWDEKLHKRHLQFLRLEFETKLGMHSPR